MIWFICDFLDMAKREICWFFEDFLIPRIKIGLLYPFAKLGIVKAQLAIADILYIKYWDIYENPEIGLKWTEKGVRLNNPKASVLRGHFYRYKARQIQDMNDEEYLMHLKNPDYVLPDDYYEQRQKKYNEKERQAELLWIEVLNCYKKAAEMNYALGQFNLYRFYNNYRYCLSIKFKTTGNKYLKLAAENGCANAQYLFAEKCLEHDDLKNGLYWMTKAVHSKKSAWTKDEGYCAERKSAREWYKKNKNVLQMKKLSSSGNPKALYDYSEYLMHGSHKRTSLNLGHKWHTKAAKTGYPKAMEEEGEFIIHGWVSGTLEEAFDYLQRAYNAGCKKASWGLGDCYYYGLGIERDFEKAKHYYKIAKRHDIGINMRALKKINEEDFWQIDCKQALKNHRDFYN